MKVIKCKIITCPEWGARKPTNQLELVGQAQRIIFHHTASHHREISGPNDESVAEAMLYARDIQRFHVESNGWSDSGHNFLVTRSGVVLQGRWLTVSAIEAGHMVRSAHCPGENDQIGIEHEHLGDEQPTNVQLEASARLMAWIASQYGLTAPLPVEPHSAHFATACPGNLRSSIPFVQRRAGVILRDGN